MKLIDLLVQELPKRGGWPNDAEYCHLTQYDRHCLTIVFSHKQVGTGNNSTTSSEEMVFSGIGYLGDTLYGCIVTAKEYESALAASQKPAWSGEGLPPVGAKCSIIINDMDFGECEILFVGESLLVWRQDSTYQEGSGYHRHMKFRPIRTEADRKRDAAVEKIKELLMFDYGDDPRINDATFIYDAIAAGKIPGVKLED